MFEYITGRHPTGLVNVFTLIAINMSRGVVNIAVSALVSAILDTNTFLERFKITKILNIKNLK